MSLVRQDERHFDHDVAAILGGVPVDSVRGRVDADAAGFLASHKSRKCRDYELLPQLGHMVHRMKTSFLRITRQYFSAVDRPGRKSDCSLEEWPATPISKTEW